MAVPTTLTAGNSWTWTHEVADYPATTWAGVYYLRNADRSFEVVASASGAAFAVNLAASATALMEPGPYQWVLLVTSGTDRHEAGRGEVQVFPDPAYATSYDFRSAARRRFEMVEAYLIDPNNLAAASYSIGGRSLSRWGRGELLAEYSSLKIEVEKEKKESRGIPGYKQRRLHVTFNHG
jgi:hypothetical protein